MNNPVKTILTFLITFGIFTGLSLAIFYNVKDTPFKKQARSYAIAPIKKQCPHSPQKELYQECMRSSISKLNNVATPLEVMQMPELIHKIYELDLIQGDDYRQQAHMSYIINMMIFFEDLKDFTIERSNIDFFQIILFPYFKWRMTSFFSDFQDEAKMLAEKIDKSTLNKVETRYLERAMKAKL